MDQGRAKGYKEVNIHEIMSKALENGQHRSVNRPRVRNLHQRTYRVVEKVTMYKETDQVVENVNMDQRTNQVIARDKHGSGKGPRDRKVHINHETGKDNKNKSGEARHKA